MTRAELVECIRENVAQRYQKMIDNTDRLAVLGAFAGECGQRQWIVVRVENVAPSGALSYGGWRNHTLLAVSENVGADGVRAGPIEKVSYKNWIAPTEGGYPSDVAKACNRLRVREQRKNRDHGRQRKAAWQ